ncbi:MAG: GTP-binding protein, partial [Acutalibacteraceae bacterium]|nr:GTP-binding protein [Acutalibacteraceae bacterium]
EYKVKDMEVPVYLFTGFLEGGKSTFIQGTLEDKRFCDGEKILLLICEEGEIEYDASRFASKNVCVHTFEDKDEFTTATLAGLYRDYKPKKIVIECNGMWPLEDIYMAMPDGWLIYQEMFFADATTFLNYNSNMRQMVANKLQNCDVAIFNRFSPEFDKMEFHKIVRGLSRRADICYEYTDGTVDYDDIEDPLPFDINADVIVIKDEDYAIWYRDMMEETEKYEGKTVKFKGVAAKDKRMPKGLAAIGRHVMTCCVDDIQYAAVAAKGDAAEKCETNKWFVITANVTIEKNALYKAKGPVMNIISLVPSNAPEEPVATFY